MTEEQLREVVRNKLTMVAAPHQHPRDALILADYMRHREKRDVVADVIRQEAQKLHINVF